MRMAFEVVWLPLLSESKFARDVRLPMSTVERQVGRHATPEHQPGMMT